VARACRVQVLAVTAESPEAPGDGACRASVILARAQRREVRPNIRASLRSDRGVAGLHAQPVRGHRFVVHGAAFLCLIAALRAGVHGRVRRGLASRLPCLIWRLALAAAGLPAVGGSGRDRTSGRTVRCVATGLLCWWPLVRSGSAGQPDQELIRTHETDRRPGRDRSSDRTV
jgi:hypothetical protein